MRCLVHFRGIVCNAGGCARQFCNRVKDFGNVSFIEREEQRGQRVRQSLKESNSLPDQVEDFFNLLSTEKYHSELWK